MNLLAEGAAAHAKYMDGYTFRCSIIHHHRLGMTIITYSLYTSPRQPDCQSQHDAHHSIRSLWHLSLFAIDTDGHAAGAPDEVALKTAPCRSQFYFGGWP